MAKEYEVYINIKQHYSTFVEADSDEEAIELALDKLNNGELELEYEHVDTDINWCDEDSDAED